MSDTELKASVDSWLSRKTEEEIKSALIHVVSGEYESENAKLRAERDQWRACAEKLNHAMASWKHRCDEIDAGYPSAVDAALAEFNRLKGTP